MVADCFLEKEPDVGEFSDPEEGYLADDEIPDTLVDVLKQFAVDFVPETVAAGAAINEWLEAETELAPGSEVPRVAGVAEFEVKGSGMRAAAQPFRFYLLKRVQNEYARLVEPERAAATELLERCGMQALLDAKLARDIGRDNNLEVWC